MLKSQTQLKLSEYAGLYDIVVDKNHLLRKIKENIDFSFVNSMLKESYCEHFGRPAKEPEMMFKLMFLKKLYDLSDEALIQNTGVNMAYKYFLGMNPEEKPINSSLMTKFRQTRLTEAMLEEMVAETISQALEKGLIKSQMIIVDATHTKTAAKQETPTQVLRKLTKTLRKEIYQPQWASSIKFPEKPLETAELSEEIAYSHQLVTALKKDVFTTGTAKLRKLLSQVKELLADEKIKQVQSASDKEAKRGYKSEDAPFFGYKNHIAMTEERLITALEVTTGEVSDGSDLKSLLDKTQKAGVDVKEICGDKAYSSKQNLELAKSKEIKLISKLKHAITYGSNREETGFIFNKDADTYQCPNGFLAVRKARTGKKNVAENQKTRYYFDIEKCKSCPLKEGCYKDGAKFKTYTVRILSEPHQDQKDFQSSEYFEQRIKQRYMIEAKNS